MTWRLKVERPAQKSLRALPDATRRRIVLALNELAADPYAARNVKALVDRRGFRLRVGEYRVAFTLHPDDRLVNVERIGSRSDFYD